MFSMPILWCRQSGDWPNLAIDQIWKLAKKNSIYLVTHWNLSFKKWWFGIFGIWWIWVSFSMNVPHIRVCFKILFIRELVKSPPRPRLPPQNGKISWTDCRITHFPKSLLNVLSKLARIFGKKTNHYFVWDEFIFFSRWTLVKIPG